MKASRIGKNDSPPSGLRKFWHGWIKPLVVVVAAVTSLRSAVADWNDVPTPSMEPTILVGDRIFVNKLAYNLKVPFTRWRLARWATPQRGDVVVFYHPQSGKRMVKRVVGGPGDTIEMRNNVVLIDGQPLRYAMRSAAELGADDLTDPAPHRFACESLGDRDHAILVQPARQGVRSFSPVKVPGEHYFVLGDNRDNSGDSRFFGFVQRDLIVGRAIGLAFSLDHDAHFLPRWRRFFRGLP